MNIKKTAGFLIFGRYHIARETYRIHKETGKSIVESAKQSVKELVTEDLPGTSHYWEAARYSGEKEGRARQATIDAVKMADMNEKYEENIDDKDRIIKDQGELIEDMKEQLYPDEE